MNGFPPYGARFEHTFPSDPASGFGESFYFHSPGTRGERQLFEMVFLGIKKNTHKSQAYCFLFLFDTINEKLKMFYRYNLMCNIKQIL